MAKKRDLTGQRFGRWTVISLNEEESNKLRPEGKHMVKRPHWNCVCDCGNVGIVSTSNLIQSSFGSCGCYNMEKLRERSQDNEYRQKQRNVIKKQWQDEEFRHSVTNAGKRKTGKNNSNWKGGITPIMTYLHMLPSVKNWFRENKRTKKCCLTGTEQCLQVHHLYSFNAIVFDAHTVNNIEIKNKVKDYTDEEIKLLENHVSKWHEDNSNAAVLCEQLHYLFHKEYGYGNNTPEQFEEFKQRYLTGEFNTEDLTVQTV